MRSVIVVAMPILAALLALGCPPGGGDEPGTDGQDATQAPEADLSALELRRAGTDGARIEREAAAARSAGATRTYAARTEEPALIELEAAGKSPLAAGAKDVVLAGESVPSDLDRPGEEAGPWIDMGKVDRAIEGQQRRLKTCHDEAIARRPSLGSRVDLRIVVDASGHARSVKLADTSPAQDLALERCLAGVIERTVFPAAENGDKAFTYPITF